MVYGIGTDICEVRRFEKWLKKPDLFLRFFNENEQFSGDFCQNEGAAKLLSAFFTETAFV